MEYNFKNTNKCEVNWLNKSVTEIKSGFTKSSVVVQDSKLGLLYTNKFTNKKIVVITILL